MSKPKVTPAPPGPQDEPAPRSIPLSDITITWPPLRDFSGEPEKPITVSGKRLGAIVAWMARTSHGTRAGTSRPPPTSGLISEGSPILRGLGNPDLEMIPSNTPSMLCLLATMVDDMTARLAVADDMKTDFKDAVVTIGAPAPEAAR